MDMTHCPACGLVAEVVWREVLESTDGPVEHAKVRCADRHWFLLPVASLPGSAVVAGIPRGDVARSRG
ncbi:MAG: hypothetical protein U0R80_18040 [Nocardioidaceae bacterium]